MADDNPRIGDLRRRVEKDPASIAFASLAEEHRRAGDLQEAVRVCRAGLQHHPGYVLAHVTLGRALMELAELPEARTEFEYVLRVAPDNLVALKGIEELQHKEDPASAPAPPVAAVARAPLKLRPDTEDASPARHAPFVVAASPSQARVAPPPEAPAASPPAAADPALEELEGWLAALNATRADRG